MTTVLRIIRRGYPPLPLPCWLEPTFLENWLRFHESSLSPSLRSLCLLRKRRRERVAEEGETMTWSWLTNGNSLPLQPRSRLIIFSETSTFNWCFLIDCPSQAGARTTKAFETRISRCSNSVWQVSFAPRTSFPPVNVSLRLPPSPFSVENSLNAWQRSGLSDTTSRSMVTKREERRRRKGMDKRNYGDVVALM